ncbi:5'-nucleotidase C-terminal domain-containing protein, partial [bacterium]|nr:5'-nucleotidase C-terminal domain-containing protein [candidate division CSSED10-310 bacterium]
QILTRSVQGDRLDEDGGFLHVSGLKLRVKGHMPYDITVADKPLDLRRVYKTVITDFMAEGGDGYHYFKGKTTYRTGSPLRELIVDTFRLRHEITSSLDGRIIRESE